MKRALHTVLIGLSAALVPAIVFAQAYGQGDYNEVAYSNGVISIGGINLPNTGTTWVGLIAIVLAAVGAGILIYRRTRRDELAK